MVSRNKHIVAVTRALIEITGVSIFDEVFFFGCVLDEAVNRTRYEPCHVGAPRTVYTAGSHTVHRAYVTLAVICHKEGGANTQLFTLRFKF